MQVARNPYLDSLPRSVQVATQGLLDVWDRGCTGQGVGIAMMDTGINDHPDVAGRVVARPNFITGQDDGYDDVGHGTATAVMAAGNGAASNGWYCGAAPDAHLVALKVVGPDNATPAERILAAIDWAVDNQKRYNIRVLNMSLGMDPTDDATVQKVYQALDRACDAGIIPVAAAGNGGGMGVLASYPRVVTVAAYKTNDTIDADDDQMWENSSRGPGLHGEAKPNVSAPGYHVGIATPDGGYSLGDGTSFASPDVAGVIADWVQANPKLNIDSVQQIIRDTSRPMAGFGPDAEGAGEIRPLAGLEEALRLAS